MIVVRYLVKEVLTLLSAVLIVVMVIALADQIIKLLSDVAQGHLSVKTFFQLILLYIPYLLTYLLPFALYLSLMIAYGRLYSDHEMIIFFSSGLSYLKFYWISCLQILLVALIVGCLSVWVMPEIKQMRRHLKKQSVVMLAMIQNLHVGEMDEMPNGKGVVYIGGKDKKNYHDVFMSLKMTGAKHAQGSDWQTVLAKSATPKTIKEKGLNGYYFAFKDGHAYWGHPGEARYQTMAYDEYGVHMYEESDSDVAVKDWTSKRLMAVKDKDMEARGELAWRIAQPISTLILGLIAIHLSQIDPRRGKFSKLIPAILIYIIYLNTMLLMRSWISNGKLSTMWGMWGLHVGMFLMLCLLILWRHVSPSLLSKGQRPK